MSLQLPLWPGRWNMYSLRLPLGQRYCPYHHVACEFFELIVQAPSAGFVAITFREPLLQRLWRTSLPVASSMFEQRLSIKRRGSSCIYGGPGRVCPHVFSSQAALLLCFSCACHITARCTCTDGLPFHLLAVAKPHPGCVRSSTLTKW